MPAKQGDKVTVEYEGKLEDGTVFDASSKHGKPLEFTLGQKQVVPGFENAIIGMEKGEEKDVSLSPDQAYGQPNPQMVKKIPKEQLPKDQEPKVGMTLMLKFENGQQIPAPITEVSDNDITLDLNHPLAGKTLNFHLKLVEISPGE